ncbi:MAG: hypothetical protein H7A23_11995 [Leptospiraceae bacterium]|nr:hypothetical protein [Leptospiraceae bacterium]
MDKKELSTFDINGNTLEFTKSITKTRPYLYFDTENNELLNYKMQLSLRKRTEDYMITFKEQGLGFEGEPIAARIEKNAKVNEEIGEKVFKHESLSFIEDLEPIQLTGFSASQLSKSCSFTVETNIYFVYSEDKQICRLSLDKIFIEEGHVLYEIELEFNVQRIVNLSSIEEFSFQFMNYISNFLKKRNVREHKFRQNRIIHPKYLRVLSSNPQVRFKIENLTGIQNFNSEDDLSSYQNTIKNVLQKSLEKNDSAYIVPCLISISKHRSYLEESIEKIRLEMTKSLMKIQPGQADRFAINKLVLSGGEILFVLVFNARTYNHFTIHKKIEGFLWSDLIQKLSIETGQGKELFDRKIQLNIAIGAERAIVQLGKNPKTTIINNIFFFLYNHNMHIKDPNTFKHNVLTSFETCWDNLYELEKNRYNTNLFDRRIVKDPFYSINTNHGHKFISIYGQNRINNYGS